MAKTRGTRSLLAFGFVLLLASADGVTPQLNPCDEGGGAIVACDPVFGPPLPGCGSGFEYVFGIGCVSIQSTCKNCKARCKKIGSDNGKCSYQWNQRKCVCGNPILGIPVSPPFGN